MRTPRQHSILMKAHLVFIFKISTEMCEHAIAHKDRWLQIRSRANKALNYPTPEDLREIEAQADRVYQELRQEHNRQGDHRGTT